MHCVNLVDVMKVIYEQTALRKLFWVCLSGLKAIYTLVADVASFISSVDVAVEG